MILETAAYMTSEQARGQEVDKRADTWSFGVVLFEMPTGRPLFEGVTLVFRKARPASRLGACLSLLLWIALVFAGRGFAFF